MSKKKEIKVTKKIISLLLLVMMLLGIVEPVFAVTVATSGTDKWVSGQFDSEVFTTDNETSVGMLMRRLVNYKTQDMITVFCAEHKVNSPTRRNSYCNSFSTNRSVSKESCKSGLFWVVL